jgi:hypothetical protein
MARGWNVVWLRGGEDSDGLDGAGERLKVATEQPITFQMQFAIAITIEKTWENCMDKQQSSTGQRNPKSGQAPQKEQAGKRPQTPQQGSTPAPGRGNTGQSTKK